MDGAYTRSSTTQFHRTSSSHREQQPLHLRRGDAFFVALNNRRCHCSRSAATHRRVQSAAIGMLRLLATSISRLRLTSSVHLGCWTVKSYVNCHFIFEPGVSVSHSRANLPAASGAEGTTVVLPFLLAERQHLPLLLAVHEILIDPASPQTWSIRFSQPHDLPSQTAMRTWKKHRLTGLPSLYNVMQRLHSFFDRGIVIPAMNKNRDPHNLYQGLLRLLSISFMIAFRESPEPLRPLDAFGNDTFVARTISLRFA